ncbi:hypothetical protein PRIPAC_95922 [Pristionchus pacificus]|uniref:Amino_oxidase domain-containing protein n=1 Tax=Pristionchus pacificus TaxID=54126 RepID=A0A2A6D2U2_PRIPA|nr:hypothetical protein PRIPAC_95922 [Pristionchus pacificus]|eukprot:PDM84718.1 hypothetical protein PRIPAC_33741 [Pristionchus pacificus]
MTSLISSLCLLLLPILAIASISEHAESLPKFPSPTRPRVAIIGAGMAGLSTARRLNELNIGSVDIYEALDRIGGRINSVPYFDGYIQHGAQFINGDKNPLYEIANELGVVSDVLGDLEHVEGGRFFYGDCKVTNDDLDLFTDFTAPLDPKYRAIAHEDDVVSRRDAIYDVYQRDYAEFLQTHNISGHRRHVFDALSLTFRSYWEFEWASDWKDQSLRNLVDWDDKGAVGVSFTTNKIGYKAIIEKVAEGRGSARLHLNSPIGNIKWDDLRGVILTFENGTTVDTIYDYVIVTTSLGHLKKYHTSLFTPNVHRYRKRAIEKIGFGGSAKVFFRWANKFWNDEDHSIVTLAVKGCNGKDEVDAFDSEITTLQQLGWESNTMVAWIAGRGPRLFDEMEDEEISYRITDLMRRLTNNATLEAPELIVRQKLTKNKYLLGSYSYVSVAQTAIGAFLSGRREADRLAEDWSARKPASLAGVGGYRLE